MHNESSNSMQITYLMDSLLGKVTVQVVPLRILATITKSNHLPWKYFQLFPVKLTSEDNEFFQVIRGKMYKTKHM